MYEHSRILFCCKRVLKCSSKSIHLHYIPGDENVNKEQLISAGHTLYYDVLNPVLNCRPMHSREFVDKLKINILHNYWFAPK